jgi:hypothetical protein
LIGPPFLFEAFPVNQHRDAPVAVMAMLQRCALKGVAQMPSPPRSAPVVPSGDKSWLY